MAAEVWEKPKSRSGKDGPADNSQGPEDPNISIVYGVIGTDDETIADAAIDANAPATWNGLTRQYWQREFIGGVGESTWRPRCAG